MSRRFYRGIHFNATEFTEQEVTDLAEYAGRFETAFRGEPLFSRAAAAPDELVRVYLDGLRSGVFGWGRFLQRSDEVRTNVNEIRDLGNPPRHVAFGHTESIFHSFVRAYNGNYFHYFLNFLNNNRYRLANPPGNTGDAARCIAHIRQRLPRLQLNDNPFVSIDGDFENVERALLRAAGHRPPAGELRPQRVPSFINGIPSPRVLGLVFVIDVPQTTLEELVADGTIVKVNATNFPNRHNQALDELLWIGHIPGTFVKGAIPVCAPDLHDAPPQVWYPLVQPNPAIGIPPTNSRTWAKQLHYPHSKLFKSYFSSVFSRRSFDCIVNTLEERYNLFLLNEHLVRLELDD